MRKRKDRKRSAPTPITADLQKTGKPSTLSQRICNDILP